MGNDGALALRRKDIVKDGSKEEKTRVSEIDKWTKCALTNEQLDDPIVSDSLGRLYNKEAILEWLLNPDQYTEKEKGFLSHINSMKDVVELKPERKEGKWVCSISNKDVLKEFGSGKFVYFAECGHVLSQSALKNISTDMCLQCEEPVNSDFAVIINPQPEDVQKLKVRMEKLKADNLAHSLRKIKRKSSNNKDNGGKVTKSKHSKTKKIN